MIARLPLGLALAAAICLSLPLTSSARTVTIGGSGGYLNYGSAQATLGLVPGDTVYIAAGTYEGITIGNITGSAAAPITVKCDPNAVFSNPQVAINGFFNLAFVNFEDFRFENFKYRCVPVSGNAHDLLFKNFRMINCGDYFFRIYDAGKVFDGTRDSTYYNFTFDNIYVDGGAPWCCAITTGSGGAEMTSVSLDWEIRNSHFSNIIGTVLDMQKSFNLKVHDNTFSDTSGVTQTNHVASLYLSGYGTIYNNSSTRIWGNDVRSFPLKLNALGYNGPDAIIKYYNNITWDKKKYPMFEHNTLTQADLDASNGLLSRTTSEVSFNTLYRSRKLDYIAPMVDIYAPYIVVKHNLVIEPECDVAFDPAHNYVYSYGSGPQAGAVFENNLVYSTFAASGLVDAVRFVPSLTSPARNAATGAVSYIATDRYGRLRYVGPADVGAVERQILGDFNGDGSADIADYTTWADHFGQSDTALAAGSSNDDGAIDIADYTTWADHFGQTAPVAPMTVTQSAEAQTQAAPGAAPAPASKAAAATRARRSAERRAVRLGASRHR